MVLLHPPLQLHHPVKHRSGRFLDSSVVRSAKHDQSLGTDCYQVVKDHIIASLLFISITTREKNMCLAKKLMVLGVV